MAVRVDHGSNLDILTRDDHEPLSSSVNLDVNEPRSTSLQLITAGLSGSINLEVQALFENGNVEIDELNILKNINLLIEKLKGLKIDEFISFLKAKKDTVDKIYTRQNAAVSTFSGVSAVGGGMMLAGGACALATAGGSFALILAGGITVGVGTFGSVGAQIFGKFRRYSIMKGCKEELEKFKSSTKEIDEIYKEFHNKCSGVCKLLEKFELNAENLKKLNPIIFKFVLIGQLSGSKLAIAAGAGAVGTHVVRSSNVLAQVGKLAQLKILGKVIVPTLKITQVLLGVGMALSGLGILFDIAVGGKALYDFAKGTECSESKKLSCAISEVQKHAKVINSYLQLLEYDAAELLRKAIQSTRSIRQQITDQTETIQQLKRDDDQKREEIEQLRKADDEKTAEIERLRKADEEKAAEIEQLRKADNEKTAEIKQLREAEDQNKAQFKKLWDAVNQMQQHK